MMKLFTLSYIILQQGKPSQGIGKIVPRTLLMRVCLYFVYVYPSGICASSMFQLADGRVYDRDMHASPILLSWVLRSTSNHSSVPYSIPTANIRYN